MPALRAALARLSPTGQLRGLFTMLRVAADQLSGRPAEAECPDLLLPPALAETPTSPGPSPAEKALAMARTAWAERLWAGGYLLPGGVAEVQRLSGLLPLSAATTLLLVGRDAGGAAAAIASQRGAWIAAHQHDPVVAEHATHRLRSFGRRTTVLPWDPAAPAFQEHFHHHILALEPLGGGGGIDGLLPALAAAAKPSAQLVLLDVVIGDAAAAHQAALDRWMVLEGRSVPPPPQHAMEAAMDAAGFHMHVAEDAGPRQCAAAKEGWKRLITAVRREGQPNSRTSSLGLVIEAEVWLLRLRLMDAGVIGLRRWHATLRH